MVFSNFQKIKKKLLDDFWLEKFPIFPIRNIPKDVFQTLLWGAETTRKKYWVVFEIFSKRLFFLTSKVASVSHPPPSTIHHHPRYKIFLVSKKVDPRGCFWNQKSFLVGRYKTERDQIGTPQGTTWRMIPPRGINTISYVLPKVPFFFSRNSLNLHTFGEKLS